MPRNARPSTVDVVELGQPDRRHVHAEDPEQLVIEGSATLGIQRRGGLGR
jgi:hypothetical protein